MRNEQIYKQWFFVDAQKQTIPCPIYTQYGAIPHSMPMAGIALPFILQLYCFQWNTDFMQLLP